MDLWICSFETLPIITTHLLTDYCELWGPKHICNFDDSLQKDIKRLEQGLGYYIILLGLTSGMRFGEIVGLTKNDFDFKSNEININKTWGYT